MSIDTVGIFGSCEAHCEYSTRFRIAQLNVIPEKEVVGSEIAKCGERVNLSAGVSLAFVLRAGR